MPSRQNERLDAYDAEIEEILESPVGTFSPAIWRQARVSLKYLLDHEDIAQAFNLLDRMAQEPDRKIQVTHELVYSVVLQWLKTFTKQQQQTQQHKKTSKGRSIFPPLTVWRKIESYQRKGIPLESSTYHRMIEGTALVKPKHSKHGPLLAETILERMMTLSKHKNPMVRPYTYTFNAVLMSWVAASSSSQSAYPDAHERALSLLRRLQTLHETGWGDELMPDKNTYRRVMNLHAHRGDGDQVEALLEELYTSYLDNGEPEHLLPTTAFFSLVLYAWSKSDDPTAAERALAILDHMLELEASGDIPRLEVNAACFNIVMICWSRLRSYEAAVQVDLLFDRLKELAKTDPKKKPIGGTYSALINTWSRIDPAKAEEIFWIWKQEYDEGRCEMRMDAKLFSSLIGGWYNSKEPDKAERCDKLLQFALENNLNSWEANRVVFNMTINAWCRLQTVDGLERGEAILRQMLEYSKKSDPVGRNSKLQPSLFSIVPIIYGWADLGQVDRAESHLREWFEQMPEEKEEKPFTKKELKHSKLDTRTFNYVLKAWLSQAALMPEAASRAEDLLLSMRGLSVKPSISSFQRVLDCHRRCRGSFKDHKYAPRVKEVLAILDQAYKRGDLSGVKSESYLRLRQGWSLLDV